jgi:hypothetical protein
MNNQTTITDVLYSAFDAALYCIPVVGTVKYAKELYDLSVENLEIAKYVPSVKNLSSWNDGVSKSKNAKVYDKLSHFTSEKNKIKASKYFAQENQVYLRGFYGSIVQTIICIAAVSLNPAFLILGKVLSLSAVYAMYNLCLVPDLFYYDEDNKNSKIRIPDYIPFQSDIFGYQKSLFDKSKA